MSRQLDIGEIVVRDRLRPLDEARVELLAESMRRQKEAGLRPQITPIEVSRYTGGKFLLVSGLHRLAAAKKVGLKQIEAEVTDGDADQRRLREIEENLCRHDLTALDRAFALQAWFGHFGVSRKGGADEEIVAKQAFDSVSKRLTAKIADRVGLNERTIYRDLKIARLLADDRDAVTGTAVVNSPTELLMLAKTSGAKRASVIKALRAGKTFKEASASKKVPAQPKDQALSALIALWRKTPVAAKRAFIKAHDREIDELINGKRVRS